MSASVVEGWSVWLSILIGLLDSVGYANAEEMNFVLFGSVWDGLPCGHALAFIIGLVGVLWFVGWRNKRNHDEKEDTTNKESGSGFVKIFYGTQTGTAKKFSNLLSAAIRDQGVYQEVIDLKNFDPEKHILNEVEGNTNVHIFVISTYTDGQPPEDAVWFYKWLEESTNDFRVQKTLLNGVKYAVFGLGNSDYKNNYNLVSKGIDKMLSDLNAMRLMKKGDGNENETESKHGGIEGDFEAWKSKLLNVIIPVVKGLTEPKQIKIKDKCECSEDKGCCEKKKKKMNKEEGQGDEEVAYETSSDEEEDDDDGKKSSEPVMDLEDLGSVMTKLKQAKDNREEEEKGTNGPKEMVTPLLRKSLTKQGYKLIGSHSGVKLCRWTKSMLRGRGGCYKHTFYGIESHRCMETTPSLACANKCVFCWRHHTNPVGTEWRWKMDDPETVVKGALQNHYKMINEFKGVPGVIPERLAEGMTAKHCALSLVGEPIMYPEINTLIQLLHSKEISTFLVTNAQFPDAIRSLEPVTQLYVSVDASTKDSLKKIDRPLFRDFWPRFLNSLKALSEKGQRTVYRLTIVKAWNSEEVDAYANLVSLGKPDFIEVKGVTYCGTSKASSLTMENVPWHEEVVGFVENLANSLNDYEIASEHAHSNCVLLAHKKFKVDGIWHTWIDYDKFHELIQDLKQSEGDSTFRAEDYMAATPHWAVYGSAEQGFDPVETRFYAKGKKKRDLSGC
ncbi:S-adenosyl-L-methionine-dependent tRNA 4-demethylwyosine synthase TYW1-like isoform X2 [Antedon mediterranea]|uniref:S-adenosyl-L-methionine-dependent tRNA 4-demethylwyosine synthase TYW1-like isoform X2 n=1 Tax=Antedon mediterranea TaxID=105859 RepID=UPI003AF67A40